VHKQTWITAVLIALCLFAQPQPAPAQLGSDGVAARVNGVAITSERLDASLAGMLKQGGATTASAQDPAQRKALKRQVLDALIGQELLWQEASKQGYVASAEEVDAAFDQARKRYGSDEVFRQRLKEGAFTEATYREDLKRQLSVRRWVQQTIAKSLSVSDEEIHAYYTANSEQFVEPARVRVRHILIKVDPDADAVATEAARKRIEAFLVEARGGADFAALAQQHSEGPSAAKGGDLGYVAKGQLVEAFEEVAFALKPGQISDVVRTRYGFHIIKVEARQETKSIPEKLASDLIRRYLLATKVQDAARTRVPLLREHGAVEVMLAE
jgi:peptidyl-prolyl cis-trans isomerase C